MEVKSRKPARVYKTTTITLLNGKKRRIVKSGVVDVSEQFTIDGGVDVVVTMCPGKEYLSSLSREKIILKLDW